MLKSSLSFLIALLGMSEVATAQQQTVFDGKIDYRARENTAGADNDIVTIDLGYTRLWDHDGTSERGFRLEGFAGHHNLDPFIGARFQLFQQTQTVQYGAALSIDSVLGEDTGADLVLTGARHWENWSLFGHAGVQYLSEPSRMDGDDIAPIASLRAYYYPLESTALSFGASIDGDDPLLHASLEYQQAGAFNGFFFEWVVGPNGYRGEDFYNTLRIGLRASSFEGMLKARQRRTGDTYFIRALDSR